MPENVTQSDSNREQNIQDEAEQPPVPADQQPTSTAREEAQTGTSGSTTQIIWTPAFLLLFALTLVLGLSADSLFAQGWSTRLFTWLGPWFILAHIGLAIGGWLALGVVTRSRWIRIGCIFGGVCSAFMSLNVFTNLSGIDPGTPVQSYINVATCMALLGAYIGLSIEDTLLSSWDTWLFFLTPVLGAIGVTLTYFLTPQASIITVENAVATATMIACCIFWWLRPSCWKTRLGPTFIFGLVPAILLAMALVNASLHNFFLLEVINPRTNPYINANNFFLAQVILLCLLLGCMRLTKSEIRN